MLTWQLEVAKELFEVFTNRIRAYRLTHYLGLITFSTRPRLSKPIGSVPQDFQSAVSGASPTGLTAIWDALVMAEQELSRLAQTYPCAKKRIVVLSDGEDNESKKTPQEVCLMPQVNARLSQLNRRNQTLRLTVSQLENVRTRN